MGYSTDLLKARSAANTTIESYPNLASDINEAFDLMLNEIEAGESENNEIDHFYSYMVDLTS